LSFSGEKKTEILEPKHNFLFWLDQTDSGGPFWAWLSSHPTARAQNFRFWGERDPRSENHFVDVRPHSDEKKPKSIFQTRKSSTEIRRKKVKKHRNLITRTSMLAQVLQIFFCEQKWTADGLAGCPSSL
jgi:hypothetical protein